MKEIVYKLKLIKLLENPNIKVNNNLWLSFGFYDYVSIAFEKNDDCFCFDKLLERSYDKKYINYKTKIMYIYKPVEDIDVFRKHFENDSTHFQIISFVRFDSLDSKIKEKIFSYKNCECFYSSDDSSIVCFIKDNDLDNCIKTLKKINGITHRVHSPLVCYSILCIKIDRMEEESFKKSAEEFDIDKVSLCIKVKDMGRINDFLNAIKKIFPNTCVEMRVGDVDLVIEIQKVNLYKISTLYQKNGLLDRENKLYKEAIQSSYIVFNFNIENNIMAKKYNHTAETHSVLKEYNKIKNSIYDFKDIKKTKFIHLFNQNCQLITNIETTLYSHIGQMLALPTYKAVNDYLIDSKNNIALKDDDNVLLVLKYLNELLQNIYLSSVYMHYELTALQPYYYLPSVLLEFYYSYILLMNSFLSFKDKYSYTFSLLPTASGLVIVKTINNTTKAGNRFLVIKVPISIFYQPRDFMFIIAHEISHFAGDMYRNREIRWAYLLDSISIAIAYHLLGFIVENEFYMIGDTNLKDSFIKAVILGVSEKIKEIISKCQAEISYDNKSGMILEESYYIPFLVENLVPKVDNILIAEKENILNRILTYMKKILDEYIEINEIEKKLKHIEKEYLINCDELLCLGGQNTLDSKFNDICYLMKECYADLLAIHILDMKFDEYYMMFDEYKDNNNENVRTVIRVAAISEAMNWELPKNNKDDKRLQEINSYLDAYKNKKDIADQDIFETFRISLVFNKLVSYLKICKDAFPNTDENIRAIRKTFLKFENVKTIKETFDMMKEMIDLYHKRKEPK